MTCGHSRIHVMYLEKNNNALLVQNYIFCLYIFGVFSNLRNNTNEKYVTFYLHLFY
jgi:hypothetical protein